MMNKVESQIKLPYHCVSIYFHVSLTLLKKTTNGEGKKTG